MSSALTDTARPLGWLGIMRLGLVQAALGGVVALTTSTLNRVAVVEYGLAASLPAALVAWHYAVQLSRPHWGHASDVGRARTPWIMGGVGALGLGAVMATDATILSASSPYLALVLSVLGFSLIGAGVGAAGTSLLALLATAVAPERRPAAAAITWIMMVMGIVITAGVSGSLLDPFSPQRLALVATGVALVAFVVAVCAIHGVEKRLPKPQVSARREKASFARAARAMFADPIARRFTLFVFLSMLAYSAQDLILEPFAGLVFGFTPGESTKLAGVQHSGVLLGMILVGAAGAALGGHKAGWMKGWTVFGCAASALALTALALASQVGPGWPLAPTVFALGAANGVFAVSAIGSMMGLAGGGEGEAGEGMHMGVWGAAQAIAFGLGGFLGAVGVDGLRAILPQTSQAFLIVFTLEAGLFLCAAVLAWSLAPRVATNGRRLPALPAELEAR
jgi:MFS transporter, BCD family, chlorophyll transporter